MLHGLEVCDARAELAPLVHVRQCQVERALRQTDHLRACGRRAGDVQETCRRCAGDVRETCGRRAGDVCGR